MASFSGFLLIYVFGGITFLPLAALLIFVHAYLTLPTKSDPETSRRETASISLRRGGDTDDILKSDADGLPQELRTRAREPDVAAGHFAVCREYVPRGVNGKPPERTTPAGAAVAVESPSVYQSMYRTIFDRNKMQTPVLEGASTNGKAAKRARNVFYVVLRSARAFCYLDTWSWKLILLTADMAI